MCIDKLRRSILTSLTIIGEEAHRLRRRHKWPPFVKVEIAQRGTPEYEDAIYSANALFIKEESGEIPNLPQRLKISERLNPLVNKASRTVEISTIEDLKAFICPVLSDFNSDPSAFNIDKAEVWIIYGKGGENSVTKLTSGLPIFSSAPSYPDATFRGGISVVVDDRALAIPVFSWLDYEFGSQVEVCITEPDNPMLTVSTPEGYEIFAGRTLHEVDDQDFETSVWEAFKSKLEYMGMDVSRETYEPNGHTSFPDWSAQLDGINYAIEITRLQKDIFYPRLIDTSSKSRPRITDKNDPRLADPIRKAKLNEQEIRLSIEASLEDKSSKTHELQPNQGYILIIVSEWLPIEGSFRVWQNQNYSAFDHVLVARYNSSDRFVFDPVYPRR